MALRANTAPIIACPREKTKKAVLRSSILQNRKQAAVHSVTSCSHKNVEVVYEDKAMGVTCYKDEKGEMICEGYDEGPRYTRHSLEEEEQQERQRELLVPRFPQEVKIQYLKDADFYKVLERNGKDPNLMLNSGFM